MTNVRLVQATVFPVVMYRCESWTIKKAERQRIDAFKPRLLEKTLESPLDCKETQPVHPKRNQPWIFIGRTDAEAEAEAPILRPPDAKNWLIRKGLDAGKERRQEKGTTEDEMARWPHRLDGLSLSKLQELVIGKPGMLQSMGLQRVGHDWATELNWTESYLFMFPNWSLLNHPVEKNELKEQGKSPLPALKSVSGALEHGLA